MDTITRTKTKTQHYHYERLESVLIFRAVYHSKNHVTPRTVIAAILDVILNILQRWKQQQKHASRILQVQPLMKTIRK